MSKPCLPQPLATPNFPAWTSGKRRTSAMKLASKGELVEPLKPRLDLEELAENAEPLLRIFRNQILSRDKSFAEATFTNMDELLRGSDSIAERLAGDEQAPRAGCGFGP